MTAGTLALRVTTIVLFIAGGFFFPLLFIPAVLVGWALVDELRRASTPDPRLTATGADPNWKSYWLPLCESPAETAFLEAMIEAFGLTADKGILRGGGLTLDMQVVMHPYRVDFLVNSWLIVEVDGAAHHSSPEAVASDQARDAFLLAKGYPTLRIPAKVVFSTPGDSVNRVRAAIVQFSRAPEPGKFQMLDGFNRFTAGINSSIAEANGKASTWIERARLEAEAQQSPSIKTENFQSELEKEIMLEAVEKERVRQFQLRSKLGGDALLATLFQMASDRAQVEHGYASTVSGRRIRDEVAMNAAIRDRQLLERLRNREYRSAYEEARKVLGGSGDHYDAIAALLDER